MPKTKKQKFEQFLLKELKKEKRKDLFRNYKKFEHSSQLTSFPCLTSTPHYQKVKCDRDAVDEQAGQHQNHAFNRPSIDSSKHGNDDLLSSDKDDLNPIDSSIDKESSDSSIDEMDLEPNLKESELCSVQNSLSVSTNKRKKRKRKPSAKPETSSIPKTNAKFIPLNQNMEKSFFVVPTRTQSIQQERILLPVVGEEQLIMETIYNNDVTILCAQTGSGKTTQVPQFLFEAGFGDCNHPLYKGIVGITQPRRVAAVSVAKRVQQELGENSDGVVAYQIRYDSSTVGKSTCIKFMTDGILLRELSIGDDMLLTKYSCIIIDEAHERTVGTDILIGWLSRIVKLRNSGRISGVGPLKLIIMSATLRVEDFTDSRLFDSPPVIEIPGRQHKVVVHYNRVTEDNYLAEVVKKVNKIHTTMTLGAILVFVTGQNEVKYLCKKLKELYGTSTSTRPEIVDSDVKVDCDGIFNEPDEDYESEVDEFDTLEKLDEASDAEEDEVHLLTGNVEDEEEIPEIVPKKNLKLHVLPLYSVLSTAEQLKVFQPTEEDTRLVVVATNVAETSLTIPGVKYVVDTGKEKQRAYDTQTNIQKFQIQWTSAASADQRAGRAGRTGPGHCYRLYSSAVFSNYFPKFHTPEIDRIPLQGVVLNLKALGIKNVIGFPFPTAPDKYQLKDAEKVLSAIGALKDGAVTPLGEKINLFPVSPRLGKMLVVGSAQSDICPMTIAAVAGMSVSQIFIREIEIEKPGVEEIVDNNAGERTQFYKKMMAFAGGNPTSDILMTLKAIGAYDCLQKRHGDISKFCKDNFLRPKAMEEVMKLYRQLCYIMETKMNIKIGKLVPPDPQQEFYLRQIFLTGHADCVAKLDENHAATRCPNGQPVYETEWSNETEYFVIHPSSCISRVRPPPKFVIFDHIQAKQDVYGADNTVIDHRMDSGSQRKFLKIVTTVDVSWLADQVTIVNPGKLLELPQPCYKRKEDQVVGFISPTYGAKLWQLPVTEKILISKEGVPYFAQALLDGKVDICSNGNAFLTLNVL